MTAGTHLAGAALTVSLLRGFRVEVGLLEGLAFAPGIGPASRPACGRRLARAEEAQLVRSPVLLRCVRNIPTAILRP